MEPLDLFSQAVKQIRPRLYDQKDLPIL